MKENMGLGKAGSIGIWEEFWAWNGINWDSMERIWDMVWKI